MLLPSASGRKSNPIYQYPGARFAWRVQLFDSLGLTFDPCQNCKVICEARSADHHQVSGEGRIEESTMDGEAVSRLTNPSRLNLSSAKHHRHLNFKCDIKPHGIL